MATEADTAETIRRAAPSGDIAVRPVDFERIFAAGRPPLPHDDIGAGAELGVAPSTETSTVPRSALDRVAAILLKAIDWRCRPVRFLATTSVLTAAITIAAEESQS